MRTLSATDVARRFSSILDSLGRGGDEIVIVRNRQPVAKLVPGAPRMTALEALADIHRTLDDRDGEAWMKDSQGAEGWLVREARDPWA